VGPDRKVGEISIDMEPILETRGQLDVPNGLGIVDEFLYLKAHTDRPLKVTVPGPFALTTYIRPVEYYRDRMQLAEAFVPTINAEIRTLAAAGATFIQLDEPATPGVGADPHEPREIAALCNRCGVGVSGVKFGLHICFGTYRKISYAKRTYAPYFPAILEARVDQFVLEFANREMSEIERWPEWSDGRELGAGIIDIRNHYQETPEDVAERIRVCLQHVPADKLYLNPDCGFRRVARWIARRKLESMVAGTQIVRNEIGG
jgi:5-methyltetrahydropteroyltriglutamate--homocysteine methyltransferase